MKRGISFTQAFFTLLQRDLKIAEERMEPFHQDETLTEIPMEDQTIV